MSESPKISRRGFLKVAGGVAIAAGAGIPGTAGAKEPRGAATLIDIGRCDGCPNYEIPLCVAACRERYLSRVPEPVDPIPKLFPRGKVEDWSKRKNVFDRLTPYNRIYVQKAAVSEDGKVREFHIPRRCMHCDHPACATLCPFSANKKHENGAVVIDPDLCFGGAKCRDLCPWAIPQRQSGIGLYLHILPTLAGNGVLFKCDLCHERIEKNELPVCVAACHREVMTFGPREAVFAEAEKRAAETGGFLYGKNENGGTSTLYLSPVPFEKLNGVIEKGPGKPHFDPVKPRMAETNALAKAVLLSPLVGLAAAWFGTAVAASGSEDGKGGK
ncbi:MAG TPA: 4Fe-4S dicluster domain-containing protein [Syntrophales bacterium]|nr:4Fe-4S dicluster domain-containing protein [Syntrophales bacterium]